MKIKLNSKNLIVLFLIMVFSCNNYKTSKESVQFIKDSKVGDIYFIEKSYGTFTIMKITNVDNLTIDFNINRFNESIAHHIDASYNSVKYKTTQYLNQSNYYSRTYKKSELIKQYDNKIIYEIKRQ